MKKLLYILTVALLVVACKDEESPYLTLSPSSLTFDASASSQTISIKSNTTWTLTPSADWYTISPTSGSGDAEVTVTVQQYKDAAGRSDNLVVNYSATGKQQVAIVQTRPAVPSDPDHLTVNLRSFAQEFTIDVPAGYNYQVSVPDGLKVVSTSDEQVVLSVDENTTDESRTYDVKITTTDGQTIETVTVNQSWRNVEPGELVMEEIFFTGCLLSNGTTSDGSDGDQYIKITNNTKETLYADGLIIAFSEEQPQASSVGAYYEYPETPEDLGVNTVYQIPGSGKDVAIEAGKSIVLALAAQNFASENGVGCDLSKADFEFYDESGSEYVTDTDNPDVPNLDCWFKSSWTITTLHNRGYESYAIAIAPKSVDAETFMTDYVWEGTKIFDWNGYHFDIAISDAYLIPNEWVIDGVNCAVDEDLYKLPWNASIDAGYTNVTTIDSDPERYGKSVRRIVKSDGTFTDTNNSTNDFEINLNPTMK